MGDGIGMGWKSTKGTIRYNERSEDLVFTGWTNLRSRLAYNGLMASCVSGVFVLCSWKDDPEILRVGSVALIASLSLLLLSWLIRPSTAFNLRSKSIVTRWRLLGLRGKPSERKTEDVESVFLKAKGKHDRYGMNWTYELALLLRDGSVLSLGIADHSATLFNGSKLAAYLGVPFVSAEEQMVSRLSREGDTTTVSYTPFGSREDEVEEMGNGCAMLGCLALPLVPLLIWAYIGTAN